MTFMYRRAKKLVKIAIAVMDPVMAAPRAPVGCFGQRQSLFDEPKFCPCCFVHLLSRDELFVGSLEPIR